MAQEYSALDVAAPHAAAGPRTPRLLFSFESVVLALMAVLVAATLVALIATPPDELTDGTWFPSDVSAPTESPTS